jgi:type II secretory pathway component GspD/PulD (secretin)
MAKVLCRAVWAMGILAAAALTPAARAQGQVTTIRVQTTLRAPDGGTVNLYSFSEQSSQRVQVGAPGLSNVPYAGRAFGNVGVSRDTVIRRGTVTVRIIDLREEEYRQTGFRSP